MADINVKFYQTKDFTVVVKETDTTLTPEGKLPVRDLKDEFGVNTLKEIRDGKAFLIGADKHGDSANSFAGKTSINVTGESKGKQRYSVIIVRRRPGSTKEVESDPQSSIRKSQVG
jgi:hypothetical protein